MAQQESKQMIVGLDIGTSKVVAVVGEIDLDDNGLIIADINYDLSVDVFDILQIANILMDS